MKKWTLLYLLGAVVVIFLVFALFYLLPTKGYGQNPPISQYPPKFVGTCTLCEYSPAPVSGDTHAHGNFLNLTYLDEQGLFKVLNLDPTDDETLLFFIGADGQPASELPKRGDLLYRATIKFEGNFFRNSGCINIFSTSQEGAASAYNRALQGELGIPKSVKMTDDALRALKSLR